MLQLSLVDCLTETREIPLTQGKVAIVSACDYDWLINWKWYAHRHSRTWYAVRNSAADKNGKRTLVLMHRTITSAPSECEVDHVDGNGLHNCRFNLRVCSHLQNMRNMRHHQGTSSGYKGVSRSGRKWRAYIQNPVDHKQMSLGSFPDKIAAALAYNAAAIRLFGEFARLNQIDGKEL